MKVHVVVGMMSGVIQDVRAIEDASQARIVEQVMCGEYDVPYDEDKRREYRDGGGENDVLTFVVDVE